ncbi:hypothetical protein P7C70_g7106, partial [Phenoliferia sp. Uapishka_3]
GGEEEIKFGEASEVEDSDDEDEEEEEEVVKVVVKGGVSADDEDEMSLTRANKVLEGSGIENLAMMKILTPADYIKINELRTAAATEEAKNGGGGAARRKLAALSAARKANTGESDNFLTEGTIIGVQKKAKNSYEERLAMIAEGREGREKFGSLRHKKLSEKEHSTTNEEKRKKHKAFAMVAASRSVRKKNTSSLQQKSKKLRNHIDRRERYIHHSLLTLFACSARHSLSSTTAGQLRPTVAHNPSRLAARCSPKMENEAPTSTPSNWMVPPAEDIASTFSFSKASKAVPFASQSSQQQSQSSQPTPQSTSTSIAPRQSQAFAPPSRPSQVAPLPPPPAMVAPVQLESQPAESERGIPAEEEMDQDQLGAGAEVRVGVGAGISTQQKSPESQIHKSAQRNDDSQFLLSQGRNKGRATFFQPPLPQDSAASSSGDQSRNAGQHAATSGTVANPKPVPARPQGQSSTSSGHPQASQAPSNNPLPSKSRPALAHGVPTNPIFIAPFLVTNPKTVSQPQLQQQRPQQQPHRPQSQAQAQESAGPSDPRGQRPPRPQAQSREQAPSPSGAQNPSQKTRGPDSRPRAKPGLGGGATGERVVEKPRASGVETAPRQRSAQVAQLDEIEEPRKKQKMGLEDIISSVAGIQSKLESKTKEVQHLTSLLKESKSQIARLKEEKDAVKVKFAEKVREGMEALETSKQEIDATVSCMRSAMNDIQMKYGDAVLASDVKRELEALKEGLGSKFFGSDGQLCLQRNEQSRISVLRELENDLTKYAGVIEHLRSQLATKAGEIVEARDRITVLESLQDLGMKGVSQKIEGAQVGLEGAVEMQKSLAKELRGWSDKNALLQAEMGEMRSAVKQAGVELAKSKESYEELKESHDEEARGKAELSTKVQATERALRDLTEVYEAFRSRAQVEKDFASEDLSRKVEQLSTVTDELAAATLELTALRPVPGQLSVVKVELEQCQSKLNTLSKKAEEEALQFQIRIKDLEKSLECAKSEKASKDDQLAALQKNVDALSEQKRVSAYRESDLRSLLFRPVLLQELLKVEVSLSTELRESQAALASLRASHANEKKQLGDQISSLSSSLSAMKLSAEKVLEQRRQDKAAAEEIRENGLRKKAAFEELQKRFMGIENKCTTLETENACLATTVASRDSSIDSLSSQLSSLSVQLSSSESENATLSSSLATLESSLQSKSTEVESLTSDLEALELENLKLKAAVASAEDNNKEALKAAIKTSAEKTEKALASQFAVDLASVKNELKKMKGAHDEKERLLQRTLVELSKAKGRPGIDQSSSLDRSFGEEEDDPALPAQGPAPKQAKAVTRATSSDIEANSSFAVGPASRDAGPAPAPGPAPEPDREPERDYVPPQPGKKKVATEAKRPVGRPRRSTVTKNAIAKDVLDEIEDDEDDIALAEVKPKKKAAAKQTYAKKKK